MISPFYPIVDDVRWLSRFLPLGVRLVQLRLKERTIEEVRGQVREALLLCRAYKAQLVINDYWEIALEEGADFVHLGQEDLEGADLIALRRRSIRLGISTHDEAELTHALTFAPDYVALGPIYPTKLKEMRFEPQGLEKVALWRQWIGRLPLVAIGGLTPERGQAVLKAGASSAAVVTDILLHSNPEARVQEWQKKLEEI